MAASNVTAANAAKSLPAAASPAAPAAGAASWRTPVELTLLGAVWGGSFLFMRVAAADFGPFALVGMSLRKVNPNVVTETKIMAVQAGLTDITTNAIEALNRQLRNAIKTKGSFPTEDAARKLVYLAILNAVPQWTRTRGWTKALLAFKIHFGDRLPD